MEEDQNQIANAELGPESRGVLDLLVSSFNEEEAEFRQAENEIESNSNAYMEQLRANLSS